MGKDRSNDANKINAPESDYLYVQRSQLPHSGNGLFTSLPIYKDEIIAIFKGKVLNEIQAKAIADKGLDAYFINLLDGSIMDSRTVKCFAKYANDVLGSLHSGFKNNAKIALNEAGKVCLIATRKIKVEEEIFCSYGKRYWKKHS
jgi:uncharacterized protein